MKNILSFLRKNKIVLGLIVVPVMFVVLLIIVTTISDAGKSVKDVQITNVTESAFAVTWRSDDPYVGNIVYKEGTGAWLPLFAQLGRDKAWDDRDVELNNEGEYIEIEEGVKDRYTHHASVRGLKPETEYSFRVGGMINGKGTDVESVTTKAINEELSTPDPGYGHVSGAESSDSYIILTHSNSEEKLSTTLSETSTYSIDFNQFGLDEVDQTLVTAKIFNLGDDIYEYKYERTDGYKPLENLDMGPGTRDSGHLTEQLQNKALASYVFTCEGMTESECTRECNNANRNEMFLMPADSCSDSCTMECEEEEPEPNGDDDACDTPGTYWDEECFNTSIGCFYHKAYVDQNGDLCAWVSTDNTCVLSSGECDLSYFSCDGYNSQEDCEDTCKERKEENGEDTSGCHTACEVCPYLSEDDGWGGTDYNSIGQESLANSCRERGDRWSIGCPERYNASLSNLITTSDDLGCCITSPGGSLLPQGETEQEENERLEYNRQLREFREACIITLDSGRYLQNTFIDPCGTGTASLYPYTGDPSSMQTPYSSTSDHLYCCRAGEFSGIPPLCESFQGVGIGGSLCRHDGHYYQIGDSYYDYDSETDTCHIREISRQPNAACSFSDIAITDCSDKYSVESGESINGALPGLNSVPTQEGESCLENSGTPSSNDNGQFLDTGSILYNVSAQESREDEVVVNGAGEYVFFLDGQKIASKEVVMNGDGEAHIKLFYDDNGNGTRDEGEEFFQDYDQITISKENSIERYKLDYGWNLITFPLYDNSAENPVQTASALLRTWNGKGAEIKHIARYKGGQFEMYSEREGEIEFSNDFNLIPGEAYFILNYEATDVTFAGNEIQSAVKLPISNGWNMVGLISPDTEYDSEQVLDKMGEEDITADTISSYESGLYSSVVKEDGTLYGSNFNIVDKKGYFIRVLEGGGEGKSFTP